MDVVPFATSNYDSWTRADVEYFENLVYGKEMKKQLYEEGGPDRLKKFARNNFENPEWEPDDQQFKENDRIIID